MADTYEVTQAGKFHLYEGDSEPEEEGAPPGVFHGSTPSPANAKILAGTRPNGRLYRLEVVTRYIPVDPATLPDPV